MNLSAAQFSQMIKQRKKWLNKKKLELRNNWECKRCNWCQKKFLRLFRCKGCKLVFYCSRRHQKKDWNRGNHAVFCKVLRDEQQVFSTSIWLMCQLVFDESTRMFSNYWRSRGGASEEVLQIHRFCILFIHNVAML